VPTHSQIIGIFQKCGHRRPTNLLVIRIFQKCVCSNRVANATRRVYTAPMETLEVFDEGQLPADMYLDPHHPLNSEFMQGLRVIQQRMVAQARLLGPRRARAIKLAFIGTSNIDIAAIIGVSPQTISKYINSVDGKRMLSLLAYFDAAQNGPDQAARRNMLWRIAMNNEDRKPTVSIAAISNLNDMDADLKNPEPVNTAVQVTINAEMMPRGALDSP
jgi:hypothetical protein